MLKAIFLDLTKKYTNNSALAENCWQQIETAYNHKKRHYHNLTHLQHLIETLQPYQKEIKEWDTILFAVFYHDIVYNVLKNNNEEKSAAVAVEKLSALHVPPAAVEKCKYFILATKLHSADADNDCNLFTDADLCILGQPWENYKHYYAQIRKEYSIYPDIIYKPGRKKVLQHFLKKESIFKTNTLYTLYEKQSRTNLQQELDEIS